MTNKPFFSLLLPTRDRPYLVDLVLFSLTKQHFINFEIIVSDNYINKSCFEVCEKYKTLLNFRYVHPEKPLSMADNFEYALSFAEGNHVITLEDKILFYPYALQELYNILSKKHYDIINFHFDIYIPSEESYNVGIWYPLYNIYPAETFNPLSFIKHRAKFVVDYYKQTTKLKIRNKLFCGCWSMELISRIKEHHATVFQNFCPDYTSMALGSIYARTLSYDMGRTLGFVMKSDKNSHGMQSLVISQKAKDFIKESDPEGIYLKYCPAQTCMFVQCNLIATDFNRIFSITNNDHRLQVNTKNLSLRILEELDRFTDLSIEDYEIIKNSLPKVSKLYVFYDKFYNYFYTKYHPFYVMLYLKINLLGRLGISKYSRLLKHRKFCKTYSRNQTDLEKILILADMKLS